MKGLSRLERRFDRLHSWCYGARAKGPPGGAKKEFFKEKIQPVSNSFHRILLVAWVFPSEGDVSLTS